MYWYRVQIRWEIKKKNIVSVTCCLATAIELILLLALLSLPGNWCIYFRLKMVIQAKHVAVIE
jgi:hypothetical protein